MGVWEDALREAAAQRYEEVQALARQREQAAEQRLALAEFLDAVRRLQVPPRRQPFLVMKGLPSAPRFRASRRHKVVGWDIGADAVVTPDGAVFDLKNQDREPCDVERPLTFPRTHDSPQTLTELLRQARARIEQSR